MKPHHLLFGAFYLLFLVGPRVVQAVTAADYDKAGLQLYNAKNYAQAGQYFAVALQLDPQDAAGLMGSGNCFYAQGQKDQALAQYQKLLSIQPNNSQLAAFVQSLQSPAGAAPAAVAPSAEQQGVALYNQKQFAASVPYFQQAIQQNPKGADAYEYLGLAQIQAGNYKEGAVALNEYNYLHPDPPTASYAYQVRERLSPADQMWVDAQLSAAGMPMGSSALTAQARVDKPLGGYLETAFDFFKLSDFLTNANTWHEAAIQIGGNMTGGVPTAAIGAGLEPVLKVSKNFQVGIPISFSPLGSAAEAVTNGPFGYSDNYLMSAFSVGLSLKYLIFTGDFEPFVSASPFVEPIDIDYTAIWTQSGSTSKVIGNYSGTMMGAVFKAGVDWHLDDTLILTPFFGYAYDAPTQFTGTATYTNSSEPNGPSQLIVAPNPLVPGSGNSIQAQPKSTTPPPNSRPLQMDLSGLEAGIQLGAFF